MKDFKLYTKFNFAKCVHLSLLSVPEGNLCSSPEGISDFIKPYLQELQENTIIPDYLTLVSIQTIENEEAGVHILTFAKIVQNISMTMTLPVSLASNAYGILSKILSLTNSEAFTLYQLTLTFKIS